MRPGARHQSGVVTDAKPLTRDDAAMIRKVAGPFLKGVAKIQLTQQVATSHAAEWPTLLNGTVADLQGVRNWNAGLRPLFHAEEGAEAADVCVLGQTVRSKLSPATRIRSAR